MQLGSPGIAMQLDERFREQAAALDPPDPLLPCIPWALGHSQTHT